jgi:hypothetical protein
MGVVDWLLNLGTHYPDLLILVVGSAVGYALTVALERYFLPVVQDPGAIRAQQGATFIFCWLTSGTAAALLWWALDPLDRMAVRVTVSYLVGVLGFFGYPPLVRWLTAKFPDIGTAWVKP